MQAIKLDIWHKRFIRRALNGGFGPPKAYRKVQEEKDGLKKELLSKEEPELGFLENSIYID